MLSVSGVQTGFFMPHFAFVCCDDCSQIAQDIYESQASVLGPIFQDSRTLNSLGVIALRRKHRENARFEETA